MDLPVDPSLLHVDGEAELLVENDPSRALGLLLLVLLFPRLRHFLFSETKPTGKEGRTDREARGFHPQGQQGPFGGFPSLPVGASRGLI